MMKKKKDKFHWFAEAVGDYLEHIGWKAVVVGPVQIEEDFAGKFKYRLVIRFLGGKKQKK